MAELTPELLAGGFTRKPTERFREELKADGYGLLMELDQYGIYYRILLLTEVERIEAETAINYQRLDMAKKICRDGLV